MRISLREHNADFRPWRPEDGREFTTPYAFDSETTLIDEAHPWITPSYVLGAAYDGRQGFFIQRQHVAAFFEAHRGLQVVLHNASFDLDVINTLSPDLDIYSWVDRDLVWDTQLLHKLLMLGVEGHTARGKGHSTLDACVRQHLGIELPKHVTDSAGNDVRLSYGRWLNQAPNQIERVYLEYLAKDAMATYLLGAQLFRSLAELLDNSGNVWGFVSWPWLQDQIRRWGPLTHHIQLKAAIALKAISRNGLCVDLGRRDELVTRLAHHEAQLRETLRTHGYLPGQPGSNKALQSIMRRLQRECPEIQFPRTATGAFATSREALEEYASVSPFLRAMLDYKALQSLQSAFLKKMGRARLHPSFDPLLVTGRTSSFGEINAQNLPRDDRVRECFVPSPGHVFINADYSTIELATLAQAMLRQFQTCSAMADAINAGQDLHRLVASRVTGKSEQDVTSEGRQRAKVINFGKPGGMGDATLQRYAKANYDIDLTEAEVRALSDAWFSLFPEMRIFLADQKDPGEAVAELLHLTPLSYYQHTGRRQFLDHPENAGHGDLPSRILGWMCLKALAEPSPQTRGDRLYSVEELDFFWMRLQAVAASLPDKYATVIANRQPSPDLRRAVMRVAERQGVFTLTGRLRALASFCARHNTIFQGLAADGAKLALWRLFRAGYRVVNFIHDEVLVEVPEDSDLTEHAQRISDIMIDAMREVLPDVAVNVDCVASRCWSKRAERVVDDHGRLLPWAPPSETVSPRVHDPVTNQRADTPVGAV